MESDLKAPLLLPTSRRRTRTPPVTAATAMQRPAGQPRGPLHHHSPLPPTDPDEEEPSDEDNGNGGVPDPSPRHLMSSTPSHGSPANEGSSDLPDPLPTDRGVNATSGPVALALARPPPVPWHANLNQLSAMISNFSTSYNAVNISLVLPILEVVWPTSAATQASKGMVASSLLAGMMVGQVVGGALGDVPWCGRLGALRAVMILQVVAGAASAVCDNYTALALCRFILGIGAGGVYPLAAVLSAEQGGGGPGPRAPPSGSASSANNDTSSPQSSLHLVVLTFSMQGVGFLAVPLITVPLLYAVPHLQVVWRVIVALGCLPGLALLGLQGWAHVWQHSSSTRVMVPTEEEMDNDDDNNNNTNNHHQHHQHDDDSPGEPMTVNGDLPAASLSPLAYETPDLQSRQGWWDSIRHEEHLVRKLCGTAGTWFLFDVLFYGNTLFQPIVIEAAFGSSQSEDPIQRLRQTALNSLALTAIAVPGYFVAAAVLGRKAFLGCSQTPRYVMLQGFLVMSLLYLTIGLGWGALREYYPSVLVLLYSLTFFFANYGPNTTTFVLPSLVYGPRCRSTLNGMSAAAGKFGAWVGATAFAPASAELGHATVLVLCAIVSILAYFLALFCVPASIGDGDGIDDDEDDQHDDNDNDGNTTETPRDHSSTVTPPEGDSRGFPGTMA